MSCMQSKIIKKLTKGMNKHDLKIVCSNLPKSLTKNNLTKNLRALYCIHNFFNNQRYNYAPVFQL